MRRHNMARIVCLPAKSSSWSPSRRNSLYMIPYNVDNAASSNGIACSICLTLQHIFKAASIVAFSRSAAAESLDVRTAKRRRCRRVSPEAPGGIQFKRDYAQTSWRAPREGHTRVRPPADRPTIRRNALSQCPRQTHRVDAASLQSILQC